LQRPALPPRSSHGWQTPRAACVRTHRVPPGP